MVMLVDSSDIFNIYPQYEDRLVPYFQKISNHFDENVEELIDEKIESELITTQKKLNRFGWNSLEIRNSNEYKCTRNRIIEKCGEEFLDVIFFLTANPLPLAHAIVKEKYAEKKRDELVKDLAKAHKESEQIIIISNHLVAFCNIFANQCFGQLRNYRNHHAEFTLEELITAIPIDWDKSYSFLSRGSRAASDFVKGLDISENKLNSFVEAAWIEEMEGIITLRKDLQTIGLRYSKEFYRINSLGITIENLSTTDSPTPTWLRLIQTLHQVFSMKEDFSKYVRFIISRFVWGYCSKLPSHYFPEVSFIPRDKDIFERTGDIGGEPYGSQYYDGPN